MATVEKTRAERIDEQVVRDALWTVIDHQALWCLELIEDAAGNAAKGTQDITGELDGGFSEALWPNEGGVEGREHLLAWARGCACSSAMFSFLTTDEGQRQLREQALWQARLAAEMIRKAEALDG